MFETQIDSVVPIQAIGQIPNLKVRELHFGLLKEMFIFDEARTDT
jgi:hypothetical protein